MKRSAVAAGVGAAALLLMLNAPAAIAADAKAGQEIFSRCAACHTVQKGGANGLGPNLFGVVGRKAGSKPDFSYSGAMKSAGFTWTPQKLDAYIAHPAEVVPGNRMAFAGIPDARQRADVIAYLRTLK
jgi:cytochrome c